MPMQTDINARVGVSTSKAVGAATATGGVLAHLVRQLTEGSDAGQANAAASVQSTLAAGANQDLDLSGGVQDVFGGTVTFSTVKVLMIQVPDTADGPLEVGGAASNAFISPFGSATDVVLVEPGGALLLVAPGDGYTVTDATGDLLRITNGGTVGVTPTVTLVGVSA